MTQLLASFSIADLKRRAFFRGAASVFDLRGNTRRQYVFSKSPADADGQAIASDWSAVGEDMHSALQAAARQRLAR